MHGPFFLRHPMHVGASIPSLAGRVQVPFLDDFLLLPNTIDARERTLKTIQDFALSFAHTRDGAAVA